MTNELETKSPWSDNSGLTGREMTDRNRREWEHLKQKLRESWLAFSGCYGESKIDQFVYHGSEADQGNQRRVVQKLDLLDVTSLVESGTNILFIGPPGTGKDFMMYVLIRKVWARLDERSNIFHINGCEFRESTMRHRRDGTEHDRNRINRMHSKRLLCLSDPSKVGGVALTDAQADALYSVLDKRAFHQLPTWMTINLPTGHDLKAEAERVFTPPVWDRMKMGAVIAPCNWPSYRKPREIV
ncbi:ATP-binding protein [bacterium]|nr:ATP-binding protein [bacterium]